MTSDRAARIASGVLGVLSVPTVVTAAGAMADPETSASMFWGQMAGAAFVVSLFTTLGLFYIAFLSTDADNRADDDELVDLEAEYDEADWWKRGRHGDEEE